ncbi:hypothetical protein XarbCFBP8153_03060 [Xanthomonas arboricola]|nr:hypothetical protein XarbCFBP8153_03060 [Xanthomonas arboricola]
MTNASPRAVRSDSPTASLDGPSPQSPLRPPPGPCSRRGRFKARAPMARKRCLLAPQAEGLQATAAHSTRVPKMRSPASPRPGRM